MKRSIDDVEGNLDSDGRQTKKLKPSPVVFLWNLPSNASEESIRGFCHPFGNIKQLLYIDKKNQALVQMEDEDAATRLVERYKETSATMNGIEISVTFSIKKELTPSRPQNMRHDEVARVVVCHSSGITDRTHTDDILALLAESNIPQNEYIVSKLLILGSPGIAFVEFEHEKSAAEILDALSQRLIFLNQKQVNFNFSKKQSLDGQNVVQIGPNYRPGRSGHSEPPARAPRYAKNEPRNSSADYYQSTRSRDRRTPPSRGPPPPRDIPDDVIDDAIKINVPLDSLVMAPAVRTSRGLVLFDEYYRRVREDMDRSFRGGRDRGGHDHFDDHRGPPMDSARVIMFSGIWEGVSCDMLQNLCGAFGDVRRVKLSFKTRDLAFVEMMSSVDADKVIQYCSELVIDGHSLTLKTSKLKRIDGKPNVPNKEGEVLTKDYGHSDRNRYSGRNAARKKVNAPGPILHMSNLCKAWLSERGDEGVLEDLSKLFEKQIAFVPNNPTQVFIHAGNSGESARLLMNHHLEILHGRPMILSFSARETMPRD